MLEIRERVAGAVVISFVYSIFGIPYCNFEGQEGREEEVEEEEAWVKTKAVW